MFEWNDAVRARLIRDALKAREKAYAPYSRFRVGAAALMASGHEYTGCNVESASYPCGICAERNAIFSAVACGERELAAVAVVGGSGEEPQEICVPCGLCRQVMREFADPKTLRVVLAVSETCWKEMTLEELLPMSFGPEDLK